MAEIGPKQQKFTKTADIGKKRPKIAKNCQNWPNKLPKLAKQPKLAKYDQNWPNLTKTGRKCPKLAKNGRNWPNQPKICQK